jgi:hypothetical protein
MIASTKSTNPQQIPTGLTIDFAICDLDASRCVGSE